MKNKLITFIILSILAATLSRFATHIDHSFWKSLANLSPMIAITLFASAYISNRFIGFIVPFLSWLVSDIIINIVFENATTQGLNYFLTPTALGVYGSLCLVFILGYFLREKTSVIKILGITVSSSFLFYFVTNTVSFFELSTVYNYYTADLNGYITCMIAGLPFYKTAFLGDLCYVTLLFGSYYLVNQSSLQRVKA